MIERNYSRVPKPAELPSHVGGWPASWRDFGDYHSAMIGGVWYTARPIYSEMLGRVTGYKLEAIL